MAVWVLKNNRRSMVQEEEQQQHSGGRASKKPKQKKIPQRGLGVAQLEKIRLEEQRQQSKDSGSRFVGPLSQQQQSISFGSCQTHLGSQNSIFKPGDLVSDLDLLSPTPPSPINSQSGRGSMHRLGSMIWNLDPLFTAFPPPSSNDSDPVWPLLPGSVHNKQQRRAFSMVNVSSLCPSSSSGVNLQMEPPSNQSYCSNFTPSCWPEEEKIVGIKRPWPFTVDHLHPPPLPGGTSLLSKFPAFADPFHRTDEPSSSCQHGIKFERNNTNFREPSLSSPSTILFDPKVRYEPSPKRMITENRTLDAGFLTLAPPPSSNSKSKQSISLLDFNHNKFLEFESFPFYGSREGNFSQSAEQAEPRPYYSFLPTEPNGHLTVSNDRIGESAESIDLNLKL